MAKKHKKKKKTHVQADPDAASGVKTPRSFIIRSGDVGHSVTTLIADMRRVMEPNTAVRLKITKRNSLRDFVNIAGPLGITHVLIFHMSDVGLNLRIGRLPRGPTLTLRVQEYSLAGDVLGAQAHPHPPSSEFKTAPLVVLNNFVGDHHAIKLMAVMFQNMFPSIHIPTIRISECRRVVLLHYDAATETVHFRHYSIAIKEAGLSKAIRSVLKTNIGDISSLNDISEFILKNDDAESEVEESVSVVSKSSRSSRGEQSAIKLHEIGPRMSLQLIKITEGFCEGEVLYHRFVEKTPEEIEAGKLRAAEKARLKAERKAQQSANVARKRGQVDEDAEGDDEVEDTEAPMGAVDEDDIDDAEYYRREVGAEPEEEFFASTSGRGGGGGKSYDPFWKRKKQDKGQSRGDGARGQKRKYSGSKSGASSGGREGPSGARASGGKKRQRK